ncbi:MAG: histidine kinase [Chloroflexi bacterium]|nr:histidine kinase [Chloroflexota bacterium]
MSTALVMLGIGIATWGLTTATTGIPEPAVDLEAPPGFVRWVLPGGPAWNSGIRSGQVVIEIATGESELDWTLHTRGSGIDYYLSLRGATAELRGVIPLALIALIAALLSAPIVLRKPRAAAAFACLAGMVGSAAVVPAGHPVVSTMGGALMVALPVAWLVATGFRSTVLRTGVPVAALAVIAAWIFARFMAPAQFGPLDALRIAASGLAAIAVGSLLIDRAPLRAALDPSGTTPALDIAVLAVATALALSLWLVADLSPVITAVALALVVITYLQARRRVVLLVDQLVFGGREQRASIAAVDAERSRLARDIHDEPLQALSASIRRLETTPDLEAEAARLREVATQLRSVAMDLDPPALDDLGLGPALASLVERANAREGTVPVLMRIDDRTGVGARDRLPPDVERDFYRIAEEAISNALRHSGGTRVDVTGRLRRDLAEVSVIDDGIGLSSERAERAGSEGRLGLRSIRGRAAEIGADVAVAAGPNGGTAVTISWRRR